MRDMFINIRNLGEQSLWIGESVWVELNTAWGSPEYSKRRDQNRQNRASDIGGIGSSLHTGGYFSYTEHIRYLKAVLGREPTPIELHSHSHKRQEDQQWVDEREEYTRLRESQPAAGEGSSYGSVEYFEYRIWSQAVGGMQYGRFYGLGSQAHAYEGQFPGEKLPVNSPPYDTTAFRRNYRRNDTPVIPADNPSEAECIVTELVVRFFVPRIYNKKDDLTEFIKSIHGFHALDIYRRSQLFISSKTPQFQIRKLPAYVTNAVMRSAARQREAGIKFKRSHSSALTTISFDSRRGVLTLPEVTVDDSTEYEFLNMVALEHIHAASGSDVSSYVAFMGALVDSAEDVQLLHRHGMVKNGLGSDEDFAKLFSRMSQEVIVDQGGNLGFVQWEVEQYCQRRWNKCCAYLKHTYCRNPWTLISVFAAGFAIFLTLVSTVVSFLQWKKVSRTSDRQKTSKLGRIGNLKGKKKLQKAFWADSASDSSETAAEEEVTNLCLMADNLDHSDQEEKVIIDKEDLGNFLHLRTEGDRLHSLIQEADISWSLVNDTLRGNKDKVHQPRVYTLLQNARIIQHVLRSSIIPKAGDRVNITPLLSLVTHLIMTNTPFDEAQLILDYIHSLSDIRHPQTKRKKNIVLGHLVCYILEKKYNLIYPEPPTEEPIFFTNASFRSLFHDPTVEGEDSEGDKEAPSEPAPVPNQNAFHDIIQRFDTMETNFGQRFDQIDLHMKTQEDRHNLDMAWIRGQTDYINQNVAMINSYFTAFNPQPPSDQDPGA
ncbi:hypothetical protein M5K25_018974 [Dendrobium thyrsiflorum]|uniref:Uncharacterized protein n=1 Tax=Dendrobium thyrsiflorum TaxID=117978 RepID=A0ABD0UDU3_DENTH